MSDESKEAQAAANQAAGDATAKERQRMTDLMAAFPGEEAFVIAQFNAGHTVIEAKAEFCAVLQTRLAEAKAQTPPPAKAPVVSGGAAPVANSGTAAPAAPGNFLAEAKAYAKEHRVSMTEAMKAVYRENPDNHAAFLRQQPVVQREERD